MRIVWQIMSHHSNLQTQTFALGPYHLFCIMYQCSIHVMCVCVCVYIGSMCVCVCVCFREREREYVCVRELVYARFGVYVFVYTCVCVLYLTSVCVQYCATELVGRVAVGPTYIHVPT